MHKLAVYLCLFLFATLSLAQTNYCGEDYSPDGKQCEPDDANTCCDNNCRFIQPTSDNACLAANECYNAQYCTGTSSVCPTPTVDTTRVCRPATACSSSATCTAQGTCPDISNSYLAQGTPCAGAYGCNQAATCTGSSATCPKPSPQPTTFKCGAKKNANNVCELDRYCPGTVGNNGLSNPCPTYGNAAPTTTKCGDSSNICEQDIFCPGTKTGNVPNGCPSQGQPITAASHTECSPESGTTCQAASYCDGSQLTCPDAQPAADTVDCSQDGDEADSTTCWSGTRHCSGTDFTCQKDAYQSSDNVQCSAADASTCTAASTCAGSIGCPTASYAESSVECTEEGDEADASTCWTGTRHCSGTDFSCNKDAASESIVCQAETACTNAHNCDGTTVGSCPEPESPNKEIGTGCSQTCTEEGQVATCDGDGSCGICTTPGEIDDPLITGFRHQTFWFEGESGSVYNFFSQPGLAINSLIVSARSHKGNKKTSVVGAIGLLTKNNQVTFDAVNGAEGKFIVNGKNYTMTTTKNLLDLNDCVQMAWSAKAVSFSSAEFEIVFAFKNPSKSDKLYVNYINTKFVHVSGDIKSMSGVIGQTAGKTVERHSAGFKVSGLLAHDNAKNTYTKAALSCSDNKARTEGLNMGAASQHQMDDLAKYSQVKI